jgi:hypothetical protein
MKSPQCPATKALKVQRRALYVLILSQSSRLLATGPELPLVAFERLGC